MKAAESNVHPINHILTHVGAHLDEYEAVRRLQKRGEPFFPGIAKAVIRFTEGMNAHTDAWFFNMKMLPVGCVPGSKFNDKDASGKRILGECTTTIVSDYLGLSDESALKQIANEVFRCDSERGVKSTELAELVKMAHRRVNSDVSVMKWAMACLEAVETRLTFRFGQSSGEKSLKDFFLAEVKRGIFPNDKARTKLSQFVDESIARIAHERENGGSVKSITELAFIAEALQRVSDPDALDHVRFGLEHIYADQVAFWEAVDWCREHGQWLTTRARDNRNTWKLRVVFLKTDNPIAVRASRHQKAGGAGVTISRTKQGSVSVHTDNRQNITLTDFVRMVRWLELPKDKDGKPTVGYVWEELGCEGVHPLVPHWYYFEKAGQFFNGSLSKPNEEPTKMGSSAFLEAADHAFTLQGVDEWRKARGVCSEWCGKDGGEKPVSTELSKAGNSINDGMNAEILKLASAPCAVPLA